MLLGEHFLLFFLVTGASGGRAWSLPANMVLAHFLDQTDAFEHVRDVVNATLLDGKLLDGSI